MVKFIMAIFFLTLFFSRCHNNQTINKSLVYSTLNEIILQDTIFAKVICKRFDQARIPSDIKKEFFKDDIKFIEQQLEFSLIENIDTGQIFFYWRKNHKMEKAFIDTTCSDLFVIHFTYPIFSKDLNTVVIGITYEGDRGYNTIYKKQNGKWKRVKSFGGWII